VEQYGKYWLKPLLFIWLLLPNFALSDDYDVYLKNLGLVLEDTPRPSVGSIASGFGAGSGVVFTAISYSDKDLQTNLDNDDDGSIILGMGFGAAEQSLGIEAAVGITSVSTSYWGDGKFGDEGNFNLKLHKFLPPQLYGNSASVALGASNLVGWGGTTQVPTNYYLAYSEQRFLGDYFQYGLSYTLGYGTAVDSGESEGGIFGGIGVARSNYSGSLSFINDELHLSGTWYIPALEGVTLNFTRADAFNANETKRNIITLGYSYNFGEL